MSTIFTYKSMAASFLSVALLCVGLVRSGYGGIEPGPDVRNRGPAIIGTVSASFDGAYVTATVVGTCKGQPVQIGPRTFLQSNFPSLTASDLDSYTILAAGPAGCLSDFGGEDLIIQAVTSFSNNGAYMTANVVILFLVPR